MDPTLVADAVRDLLASAQIRTKDVVVAVGGRDVIIKKIQMDRLSAADTRSQPFFRRAASGFAIHRGG